MGRIGAELDEELDSAIDRYSAVSTSLRAISERHPFGGKMEGDLKDARSAALVRQAADAEREGMIALERLAKALRREARPGRPWTN